MSCRQGWKVNGVHFAKTTTERGGTRYFIDGKPTRADEWIAAYDAAKYEAGVLLRLRQPGGRNQKDISSSPADRME